MSEINQLTRNEIENIFNNFENLLEKESALPDIKSINNIELMGYLFDLLESEKYEIHLSKNYDKWKQLILSECIERGLVKKNN